MAPILLTGSGDSIVDVELPDDFIGVAHIIGNSASRHFSVINYGPGNEYLDLLVNTSDPYEGTTPIDFFDDEKTIRFEVSAAGDWSIELIPLESVPQYSVPGKISGSGDTVFVITGSTPDTAQIAGNAAGRHFSVIGYGDSYDLLVNVSEPYEGTVLVDPGTFVIRVTAEGDWEIEFIS